MRKYEYFYDSDKVLTHIDDAFKPNIYTSIEGVEFIVRDGDVNIKHYAVKDHLRVINFFSAGESPEHYNAKMKIVKDLKYYDSILKQEVHFAKVVPEKGINGKIPDLSCYDEEDNLVMLIEIKYSNEKSIEDIEKLSANKVPLIEIDIKNDNKCKHLILPTLLETNRKENERIQRLFKESSKEFKKEIEQAEREYESFKERFDSTITDIKTLEEGVRGNGSSEIWEIKRSIDKFREGIQSNGTERTREISKNIDRFRDRIQDEEYRLGDIKSEVKRKEQEIRTREREISGFDETTYKIDYRIGKVEAEIDRVELEIIQRKNNTKKIAENCKIEWFRTSWMKNPVNNKLEEIRYWCS